MYLSCIIISMSGCHFWKADLGWLHLYKSNSFILYRIVYFSPHNSTYNVYLYTSHSAQQQMYLHPLMVVCQWWHWMKQARSESLGADQHWDLVKWSLVTLCSTGEGDPPLTPLAQCLALVQPHTPSPTSLLVQCMKWELHYVAVLDWVDTAVGVGSRWKLLTVSIYLL